MYKVEKGTGMPTGLDRFINVFLAFYLRSLWASLSLASLDSRRSEEKRLVTAYPCIDFLFGVTQGLRE